MERRSPQAPRFTWANARKLEVAVSLQAFPVGGLAGSADSDPIRTVSYYPVKG